MGGTNYYFGEPSERAKMGEPLRHIEANDIFRTVTIMKITSTICVILIIVISIVVEMGLK
ncbi:hypothetical protein RGU73_29960 [Neobacillus cucumis]|nr:hypothetical protein [Neobacillus cucumis]MDR4950492.1 hypothetical protein [Neobacillus cucumis]